METSIISLIVCPFKTDMESTVQVTSPPISDETSSAYVAAPRAPKLPPATRHRQHYLIHAHITKKVYDVILYLVFCIEVIYILLSSICLML